MLTADRMESSVENSVIVWSCSDFKGVEQRCEIHGHRGWLLSAAFSPDQEILATAGIDSRILLWDADTGNLRQELVGQTQAVGGLAFTPDGKTFASASGDGTVRLWHVATGRELMKLNLDSSTWSVAFSPDGNTLAATGGVDPWAQEELHVWRVPSFEEIADSERTLPQGQSQ